MRRLIRFHGQILGFMICILIVCPVNQADTETQEYVCNNIDIRNSVANFVLLQHCTVVEGYLQILLIDNGVVQDYENLSFPKLREITGYLLLYRAFGLPSLEKLFPNLAVIRGHVLFHNYAFVVYEMFQLQEIGLKGLTDILRGSVRIEKNPNLCYVDTIDWDYISKSGAGGHSFLENKKIETCPDTCSSSVPCQQSRNTGEPSNLCWNSHVCQKICSSKCERQNLTCMQNALDKCCHHECLGGCTGDYATDCVACKHVVYQGRCMRRCPSNTFEYMNRRCVSEEECRSMPKDGLAGPHSNEDIHWKPFGFMCLKDCPEGYMEIKSDRHKCQECGNNCTKICTGGTVNSVGSAQALQGCTHINGSLDIQIQGGVNIIAELEKNLKSIKEIRGYLKIARSFPLVSLNFLKDLTVIRGERLDMKDYSLLVLENRNLKDLWDWKQKPSGLHIIAGKIFFHFNSKLCINKIRDLKQYGSVQDWDDRDVSPSSNGDRVACDLTDMNISVWKISHNNAVLQWKNLRNKLEDPRSLLGYVVYFREAPTKNISIYDGQDACGSDVWKVDDVDVNEKPDDFVYHLLNNLKPYTQYAVYVRTYTTVSGQKGGQSRIHYLMTEPDTPTLPVSVKADPTGHSDIIISWKPPIRPNGNITYYIVKGTAVVESPAFINQRNYCSAPITHLDLKRKIDDEEGNTKHTWLNHSGNLSHEENTSEKCCPCSQAKIGLSENDDVAEFQIRFEDYLHNFVYIKNPNYTAQRNRRRRSFYSTDKTFVSRNNLINDDVSENDTVNANKSTSLPNESFMPNKFVKKIHQNTFLVINELHHFTEYTIEIVACQKENPKRPPCSSKAFTTVRTSKLGGADDINIKTIQIKKENVTSKSVHIKWDEPKDPNGLIVSYSIEYKRMNVENYKPTPICITQLDYQHYSGYILNNMHPGNYSFRIRATSLAGNGNWTIPIYFSIPEEEEGFTKTTIIIISVAVVLTLFISSFIGCMVVKKSHAADPPGGILYTSVNPEYMSAGFVYEPDEWEVPRDKIALIKELGQGSFGMVYEGEAKDLKPDKPFIRCAVKTVNENATLRERVEFLQEASVMKAFQCHHVVQLLGVVAKGAPPLVIMELMSNGDLKSYLRSHRPDTEENADLQPPTLKRILQMAIEIADGMAYLSAKKFVHRDLAARNCMVAEDLTVKIGDFGMTRDIYETDYYRKGGKGLLPVRWMAPESLKDGVFTSQSDVWSYGIVLWEMATLASQPYQGLSNEQVLKYVINDLIMEKPENCPEKLYALMKLSWAKNPKARPTFKELIEILLPDVNQHFREVSFYFTEHQQVCTKEIDVDPADVATPATPLRSRTLWDESSQTSRDNSDEEIDIHYFPSVTLAEDRKQTSPRHSTSKECVNGTDCKRNYGSDEGSKGLDIHSNESSRGMSIPSSDDSKGSKISNLSNGSLANGHISYPAGRTTMC